MSVPGPGEKGGRILQRTPDQLRTVVAESQTAQHLFAEPRARSRIHHARRKTG